MLAVACWVVPKSCVVSGCCVWVLAGGVKAGVLGGAVEAVVAAAVVAGGWAVGAPTIARRRNKTNLKVCK